MIKAFSILSLGALLVLGSSVFANSKVNVQSVELSAEAADKVGRELREASNRGDKSILFIGGHQVTTYSIGNLVCYFQNSDDSVSCSVSYVNQ